MLPAVSIVIPFYNGGDFIAETIESVQRQTHDNMEVIIVDDGSSERDADQMLQAVTQLDAPVEVVRHNVNKGISAARNTGVEHANGEYITILDQDDVLLPEKIERQVTYMENNPKVGTTLTNVTHIDVQGSFLGDRSLSVDLKQQSSKDIRKWVCHGIDPPLPITTELSRSEVYDTVGNYNTELRLLNDREFLFRALEVYDVRIIDEHLLLKRYHNANASDSEIDWIKDEIKFTNLLLDTHQPCLNDPRTKLSSLYLWMFSNLIRNWDARAFKHLLYSVYYAPLHPIRELLSRTSSSA